MNLIMGASTGLSELQLIPFLQSLARTSFNGDVIFFIPESERNLSGSLSKRIQVINFNPRSDMPIHGQRYLLYKQYLNNNVLKYDNIMLTDVRDVYFQADPFNFDIDGLCVFFEDVTIGKCPYNGSWIELKYGLEEKISLYNCRACCSGITIGKKESILHYLDMMEKHLLPPINAIGYDQGIHNYLVHHDLLLDIRRYDNITGPVLTMGYLESCRKDSQGLYLNKSGVIPNVLHQYDRHMKGNI